MEGPAQEKEIVVQYTDQQTTDFHKAVAESAGVSPEVVNPEAQSTLKKLAETGAEILDVAHGLGASVGEKISGGATQIRVIETKKPSLISRIRTKLKVWK